MSISYSTKRRLFKGLSFLAMGLYLVLILFPIYWMLLTSIKPKRELYLPEPTLWTQNPTLDNVRHLFEATPFARQFGNTLLVSVVATAVAIVIGSLAGYSLCRLHYPGRDFIASAIFFTYLIPTTMTLIPLYILFARLGILNSLYCLVLTSLGGATPFSVWMLKGYFASIPSELEDAAMVDGYTRLQALHRVVLPLAAPGLVACGVFAFTVSWHQYLWPLILNNKMELWTVAVGLATLICGDVFLWGEIMAGAALMSVPVLVLYFVGQRFLVTGLTAGAVKG